MILKQMAHQANGLVFVENRPIKIGIILKQIHHTFARTLNHLIQTEVPDYGVF